MDLVQLFTQGGFALVAIGALLFIVKWFMRQTEKMTSDFLNRVNGFTKQIDEFSGAIRIFSDAISQMTTQLNHLSEMMKEMSWIIREHYRGSGGGDPGGSGDIRGGDTNA